MTPEHQRHSHEMQHMLTHFPEARPQDIREFSGNSDAVARYLARTHDLTVAEVLETIEERSLYLGAAGRRNVAA